MADDQKTEVKTSKKLTSLVTEIEGLTALELADLVKVLEEKFGVSAAPVAMAAAPAAASPAGQAAAGADSEQTVFNVVLKTDNGKKIPVLKAVRELVPTLTLMDAKKLVESLPKDLLTGVNKATAEEAKKKLEAAGAQVELK